MDFDEIPVEESKNSHKKDVSIESSNGGIAAKIKMFQSKNTSPKGVSSKYTTKKTARSATENKLKDRLAKFEIKLKSEANIKGNLKYVLVLVAIDIVQ